MHRLVKDGVQIGVLRDPVLGVDILHHLDVYIVRERTVEHDLDIKAVAGLAGSPKRAREGFAVLGTWVWRLMGAQCPSA